MVSRFQIQNTQPVVEKRKRRLRPVLLSLLTLIILLWAGYWYAAYSIANGFITDAAAAEASDSFAFGCGQRQLGGFPLQLTITCRNAVSNSGDGIRASLGGLDATALLYNPGKVTANIAGPFEVNGADYAVLSNWAAGNVGFTAGLGGVHDASAAFSSLDFTVRDAAGETQWSATAAAWSTQMQPAAGGEPAFHLVLSAVDLVIAFGGDAFPQMSGTATLTLHGAGDRIDRLPSDVLADWLRAGGAFDIDDLTVRSGDVLADITGPMKLGLNGSLTGEVVVRYSGEQDLPTLVAAIFPWYADEAETIAEAIRVLSSPIEMRGEPAYEVHLNIRDGVVNIGLIPILTIPSLGPLDHLI
jgi:hypothetical protein